MVYSLDPDLERDIIAARDQMRRGGPLFIHGEVGAGKTFLVERLHRELFPGEPLVFQEAAGLDEARFTSQVFGHVRGAFSGAVGHFPGLVGAASGGTLCFEGIDGARGEDQARLLRFLQTRRYRPLGAVEEREWQGCLVFTARHEPRKAMARGMLREDFYYRIGINVLALPALERRTQDFTAICLDLVARIEQELDLDMRRPERAELDALREVRHEGNLHGLRNLIMRAMIQGVPPHELHEAREDDQAVELPDTGSLDGDLAALEARLLQRALARGPGTRQALADALGISRRTLMYKLKAHGLSGSN